MKLIEVDADWPVVLIAAVLLLLWLFVPDLALADRDCPPGLDRNHACGGNDDPTGDGFGSPVTASADAASNADAASSAEGGNASTGDQSTTVRNKSESNTMVFGAARDTADCFTKVQLGGEGFGVGFSRSDPYCKKVRLVRRHVELGNYEAAARLECTLREWRQVYGDDKQRCFDELLVGIEAEAAMAVETQHTQEVIIEQQILIEDRMAQQQNLIEAQQAELERLRRRIQAEEREDKAEQEKFRELLRKRGDR